MLNAKRLTVIRHPSSLPDRHAGLIHLGLRQILRIHISFRPFIRTYQAPLIVCLAHNVYNFIVGCFADNFLIRARPFADI